MRKARILISKLQAERPNTADALRTMLMGDYIVEVVADWGKVYHIRSIPSNRVPGRIGTYVMKEYLEFLDTEPEPDKGE